MSNIESVPNISEDLVDDEKPRQITQRWWNWLKKVQSGYGFAGGKAQPTFASGDIQYAGPQGQLLGSDNFIVGLNIPNPGGVNGPCLLLGSGFGPGGSGHAGFAWIITDQAFDNFTPGNTLGITAGETQGAGTANGGLLWLIAGASFGGIGGEMRMFGGTSANAKAGDINVQGGGATGSTAAAIPGECFLSAGQQGKQGANIHVISTTLNGIPGAIRLRNNSTLLYEIEATGALFIANGVNSFGTNTQAFVSGGPGVSPYWLPASTLGAASISGLLPGGIILKVGQVTHAAGTVPVDVNVVFPVAFPTACTAVFVSSNRSVASAGQAVNGSGFASNITAAGCTITIDQSAASPSTYLGYWFAIGF